MHMHILIEIISKSLGLLILPDEINNFKESIKLNQYTKIYNNGFVIKCLCREVNFILPFFDIFFNLEKTFCL